MESLGRDLFVAVCQKLRAFDVVHLTSCSTILHNWGCTLPLFDGLSRTDYLILCKSDLTSSFPSNVDHHVFAPPS
jgi:hypothetical protein